ncbi:Flavinator of succinate dehydrogenase [Trypanosoma melophagium]|uniref:Flavinator of succinate dehydrogenase n=1 Tax=Trypanosoma melophagium TaxID=715481 RepID=UPI003519EC2B|nr:Flavinator of succinate dehydrogenase [Trypanosoma melophagium]
MLRRVVRRLAPSQRQQQHEALVKMWRERPPPPAPAAAASHQQFRDVRPPPPDESTDAKRRRLLYQSDYRGMTEMDIVLGLFAKHHVPNMPREQLEEYDRLLRHFDNDMFKWLVMGEAPPAAVAEMKTFKMLQEFVKKEQQQLLGHIV